MLLAELASEVRKSLEGSISSSDSRFSPEYLEWLVPQLTSKVIAEAYTGTRTKKATRMIDPACYMHLEVTKLTADQDSDNHFTYFRVGSAPVVFDESTNGLILQNRNATGTFKQVKSLGQITMLQNKGMLDSSTLYYLAWGTGFRIYGSKAIKTVFPSIVPQNALEVTANLASTGAAFNPDSDPYPFPETLMGDLTNEVKARLLLQKQMPASVLDDENPMT